MATFVLREGKLIDKREVRVPSKAASALPAPNVQSFTTYASPIDGAAISSHRQRDRDLTNSGSYDPRDTPASFRKAQNARRQHQRRSADAS